MDTTGREPQLGGQEEDNSPMLGGDRRQPTWEYFTEAQLEEMKRLRDDRTVVMKWLVEMLGVHIPPEYWHGYR